MAVMKQHFLLEQSKGSFPPTPPLLVAIVLNNKDSLQSKGKQCRTGGYGVAYPGELTDKRQVQIQWSQQRRKPKQMHQWELCSTHYHMKHHISLSITLLSNRQYHPSRVFLRGSQQVVGGEVEFKYSGHGIIGLHSWVSSSGESNNG